MGPVVVIIIVIVINAVVKMVSTCPLISKSSSLFTNPLVIVPSTPITIGITVTFLFHIIIIIYSFRVFHINVS